MTTAIIAPDPETICAAIDPESDTYCLKEPGHDGTEHKSVRATWPIDAGRDEVWGAAFIERHPQISDTVPSWADEVTFLEITDEYVAYRVSVTFGSVELATHVYFDWDGTISTADNIVWLGEDHLEGDDLERSMRDLAIDLLLTAQKMEEVA
jgi:hypothetical protein